MLSAYHRKKMLHLFHCLDSDNSGYLDKQDAENFAEAFAKIRGAEPGSALHKDILSKWLYIWENFWIRADADGDGKVSPEEYCQGVEVGVSDPHYNNPLIGALFDVIDLEGKGEITKEEHRLFFEVFKLDADQSALVFSKLDLNGNGILSKDEFVRAKTEFLKEKEPGAVGNWFWGEFE